MSATSSPTVTSAEPIVWADPKRQQAFQVWLSAQALAHGLRLESLRPASADASFRRYLRVDCVPSASHAGANSLIVVDAPPEQEDNAAFVRVAHWLRQAGLNVPQVHAWEQNLGFLLLSDLGHHTMMDALDPQDAQRGHAHFVQAIDALVRLQGVARMDGLPNFGADQWHQEVDLFAHWYLGQHKGIAPDAQQAQTLERVLATLAQENLRAPQVWVHKDFMPRNLMLPQGAAASMGLLDFQDAVFGPITYDIASLMRDAFISWEEDFVLDITVRYWERARKAGLPVGEDFGEFYRAVEWMGLQRHLRIAGVFARLTLRDGKPRYLADAPRFLAYIRSTASRYRELFPLARLVEKWEGIQPVTGFAYGRV